MNDTIDARESRIVVGGWCKVCGEPVVTFDGGACPSLYGGKHLFVVDAAMTQRYPVSIPVRLPAPTSHE